MTTSLQSGGHRAGEGCGALASRRSFVGRIGRGSAGVALMSAVPWLAGCASFPRVTPLREGPVARIPLTAFLETAGVLFDHGAEGMPVYVHRHAPTRFTAVLTRCSHRGCEVEPHEDRMVCPCHGSEYRHDGALLEGPADAPLIRYPTAVEGGFVRIDLSGGRENR